MQLSIWFLLLFVPIYFWPVTLAVVVGLALLAARSRGRWRLLAAGAATIVALPLFVGAYLELNKALSARRFRAEYARTHAVLGSDTTFDGITLPAGTEVGWSDASRTRLESAVMPRATEIFGLPARSLNRADGGWTIEMEEPRRVGAWPCGIGTVTLEERGDLISCTLSEAVTWKGWPLPAYTAVERRGAEGTVVVGLPTDAAIEAREMGRPLPPRATLNDDGSLAGTVLEGDEPLRVAGVPLWGTITWHYDPATRGAGRDRPAVAVEGAARALAFEESEDRIVVRLPDGAVTRPPRERPPGE